MKVHQLEELRDATAPLLFNEQGCFLFNKRNHNFLSGDQGLMIAVNITILSMMFEKSTAAVIIPSNHIPSENRQIAAGKYSSGSIWTQSDTHDGFWFIFRCDGMENQPGVQNWILPSYNVRRKDR